MTFSRAKLVSLFILSYIALSLYYLYNSSLPFEPCHIQDGQPSTCLEPLLYANTNSNINADANGNGNANATKTSLRLELYLPSLLMNQEQQQGRRKKIRSMEYTLVSSCSSSDDKQQEMSFDFDYMQQEERYSQSSSSSKNENVKNSIFTSHHPSIQKQCQISFPNFVRIQDADQKMIRLFKGKFVLKRIEMIDNNNDNGSNSNSNNNNNDMKYKETILAETIFDLTRINHQKQKKNNSNNSGNEYRYVPHYKYYKQHLILRIITDTNYYPMHNPVRGDGFLMQHTATANNYNKNNNNNTKSKGNQNDKYYPRHYYRPIMYVDDIALRHSSQIELGPPQQPQPLPQSQEQKSQNEEPSSSTTSKPPVKLSIKIKFMTPLRHTIQNQLTLSLYMAEQLFRPSELDELRYLISDEYMYRFILTQLIGFIHLLFDYLAFTNEIGFYVGRGKDVTGISLSSLYSRCICDIIIFLYLLDGNNTSWFVLCSIGSSIGVELWKLWKFLQPKFTFWKISFRDLSKLSSTEQSTMNYDSIARTYLSLLLYPLVFGLALYNRQFYVYPSWYSWMISNLANAVYTLGFISLCPQLYINYRLKSVAHLPLRVFVYKIFNTFVDDVFAFLIEMPLKHKIMTLRDDVVFVIFLIQAYIYRVDKKRTNEYGYTYEKEEEEEKKKEIQEMKEQIEVVAHVDNKDDDKKLEKID